MEYLSDLNNGRICNVIRQIECEKLTEKQKIKILIILFELTRKMTLNHEEVKQLCELCCRDNTVKNKQDRDKYLAIMFHILKWFLNKNWPSYALDLLNFIRPTVLTPLEDDDLANYKSYFHLFYNHTEKCYRNEKLYDTDLLIQFSIITIELFSAANLESKKSFLQISFIIKKLRNVFKNDNITPKNLHKHFYNVLRKSKPILSTEFSNKTGILEFFLSMTTITFSNFMKMGEDSVPTHAKDFITFVESQNVLPYYLNYLKIVAETSNLFSNIKHVNISDAILTYSKLLRVLHEETHGSGLLCEYMAMCINDICESAELNWKKYMNSPLLRDYVNILLLLDSFSNDNVLVKYYVIKTILQYFDMSTKFGIENIEILIPKLKTVLENIVKTLDKTNEKSQYRHLTIVYNILVRLNQKYEMYSETLDLWKVLCRAAYKYSIELLRGSLLSLSICYQQTKQYRKALTPLAVSLQFSENNKKIMQQWFVVKYNAYKDKEETTVNTSIAQIFSMDRHEMEQLCDGFSRVNVNIPELLLLELTGAMKWCENSSMLTTVCKDFIEFTTTDVVQRARGLALLWSFYIKDTEFLSIVTSTLTCLCELQKKTKNTDSEFEIIILMACLSCCIFQQKMYDLRIQNYNNILQSQTEEPIVSEDMKMMNMQMEIELIHYLDDALKLFTTALGFTSTATFSETLTKLSIPSIIQHVSNLYNLHGYQIQKIRSACLCLKYAELLKDNNTAVSIASLILENIDYQSSSAKSLVEKTDALINYVDENISIKYMLSKSLCCYYSGEYEIGFSTLNEAHSKIENSKHDSGYIMNKVKIDFVRSLYMLLPCRASQNTHPSIKGLAVATDSLGHLICAYKQHDQPSFNLKDLNAALHLLDLSLFISRKFIDMCLPKNAKCYLRDQVKVASALCLPLRTAECLSVLALVDINSSRYDDCRTKLDRVGCLLGLSDADKLSRNQVQSNHMDKPKPLDFNYNSIEIFLDLPVQKRDIENNLKATKYSICVPDFLEHDDECQCSKCTNIVYQRVLFETIHVFICLKNIQLNEDALAECNWIFKNYKSVLRKQQMLCRNSKCDILIETDILKPVRLTVTVSYARCMHSYIEILIRKNKCQVALKLFDDIQIYLNDFQDMASEVLKNLLQLRASVCFSIIMNKSRNDENEIESTKQSTLKATSPKQLTSRQVTDIITNFASPAPSLFSLPATTPSLKSNHLTKLQTPVVNKFKIYTPATERRYKIFKSKSQLVDTIKKPTEPKRSPSPHNLDRLSPGVSDKQKSPCAELKDSVRKTRKKTACKKLIDDLKITSETTETDAMCQLVENLNLNDDEALNQNADLNVLNKRPVRQYNRKQKKVLSEHVENVPTIDLISTDIKVVSEKKENENVNTIVNYKISAKNKTRKIAQLQKTSTVTAQNSENISEHNEIVDLINTGSEIDSNTEKNEGVTTAISDKPVRRGRLAQLKKSASVDTNDLPNAKEKTDSQIDFGAKNRRSRLQKTSNSTELSKRHKEDVASSDNKQATVNLKKVPGKKRILQLDVSSDLSAISNEECRITKPSVKLKKVPGKKRLLQLDVSSDLSVVSNSSGDCQITESSVRSSSRLKIKTLKK